VLQLATKRNPDIFLDTFNACLVNSELPTRWKRAKVVLLHKGQGKPLDLPSSYRSISLLDDAGKVLERLLLNCLDNHIMATEALSDLQFGFRRSRCTVDAMEEVLKVTRAAGGGPVQRRHLCAVVTLDV